MKAIRIRERGSSDVLSLDDVPTPTPQTGELLIEVLACGVNRADIILREGNVPLPLVSLPEICGLEVAGAVVGLGPGVDEYAVGDHVCALVPGAGGYAEYCSVPSVLAWPLPAGYTAVEAAALPEALMTVWNALFADPVVLPGETLLIHGGTSGIGSVAIMMAKAFGNSVMATAGSAEKCAAMKQWGADCAIDYRNDDFVDAAKQFTDGCGIDVVLDIVAGSYLQRNIDALATGGRCVQIGMMEASLGELNVGALMSKQAQVLGASLWFRSLAEKAQLAATVKRRLWPLLEAGSIRPVIDSVFPLAQAAQAQSRMEQSQHIGKIVLSPGA